MATMIGCICLVIAAVTGGGECARILLLPFGHHPHVQRYALVGKRLAEAGHDVVLLTTERHRATLDKVGIPHILHHGVKATISPDQEAGKEEEMIFFGGKLRNLKVGKLRLSTLHAQCEEMLESEELKNTLESKKFDIAIVDSLDVFKCLYIFPYRLGIPYITLTVRHDAWGARIPALPSIEGHQAIMDLTSNSSLVDRLLNTIIYIAFYSVSWMLGDDSMVTRFVPNKPPRTLSELYRNSEIILVNMDTICMDVPRVSAPHYQFVGAVGNRPAKPLPPEIDSFMKSAQNGVIVVSFGSTVKNIPSEFFDKLMDGFRQVEQRVIMRLQGSLPKRLPSNVKLVDWLPQNDMLGHNKTLLFITHAGYNGAQEALYHGVPMLCMPLYGDQVGNAAQIVQRRFGLHLDWTTFTSNELLSSVKELLNNPIYALNIQKCSKLQKAFTSPLDTVAFWVEHILKFGSAHLRPSYLEMPLWKFFMLDVICVLSLTSLCIIFVVYRCFKFALGKCGRKTNKPKTD